MKTRFLIRSRNHSLERSLYSASICDSSIALRETSLFLSAEVKRIECLSDVLYFPIKKARMTVHHAGQVDAIL